METDQELVETMPTPPPHALSTMPPAPPHTMPTIPTPSEMKHAVMSLLTASGTEDGEPSSIKILERHAKEKKDKYETACLNHRRDFTPLVYSVDGMALKDARTAERQIGWLLAKKWSRTYSDMANFNRTRMSLTIVRSNTLLLRGDCTIPMRRRSPSDD
ncbi:hypothetical protein ACHAW6_000324, partial [Cyclotella cf. meneghiniana]